MALLLLFSVPLARGDDAVDWLVGFSKDWSTAVGAIQPSPEALKVIDAAKTGPFAEADDAADWQERVLGFLGSGLMVGNSAKVLLAPNIGLPADQMSVEQFTGANKALDQFKSVPGEKILAVVTSDDDGVWELWTTEAIYIHGCGGGMSRVEKTNYGWSFPTMMFDGEKGGLEMLRFWDLALSNDTAQDVESPRGLVNVNIAKLVLSRSIEPKATTTLFATDPKRTDQVLIIQNACRRFLSARISRAWQKDKSMPPGHSGFRSAKWGTSFDETAMQLTPFLLHDSPENFISSRLTPDIALFYGRHLATTNAVARTVDSTLWPSVLKLPPEQVSDDIAGQIGLSLGTRSFGGMPGKHADFLRDTGIPVAPDFDYWSYANAIGRYTAWFIDGKFYAMEIEPSQATARQFSDVMSDLTKRYGEFTHQPAAQGRSRAIHEDEDGGTLVRYESTGGSGSAQQEVKTIHHYSLKMRPAVLARLAALSTAAEQRAAEEKAALAKKASQF